MSFTTEPLAREIRACRSCGSTDLPQVLDLGLFAISDFPAEAGKFDKAPLTLLRCEACTLVQLKHTVKRERMYSRYFYRSGTQESMVAALRDVVDHARTLVDLQPGDTVLDIGANDGTLLRMYPADVTKVAYEPAQTFWPELTADIKRAGDYFPQMIGGEPVALTTKAKIITSIACFYDSDNPNDWVRAIKANLAPDGVWINQLAYLPETIRTNNVGDICHEHLTYWSGDAMDALIRRNGLRIVGWDVNDVNGGSVRMTVKHGPSGIARAGAPVTAEDMADFAARIDQNRDDVLTALYDAQGRGRTILGYGASTKGNTYLQYWGVGPDLLPAIADRNPAKWGTFTPTGIPIISEEEARQRNPYAFLALPFHFIDSFVQREADYLNNGGQFLVPFPTLRWVEAPGHVARIAA